MQGPAREHAEARALLGMPANLTADVAKALPFSEPPPSGLSADESGAWQLDFLHKRGLSFAQEMMNPTHASGN